MLPSFLSVIVPVLNEAGSLPQTLKTIHQATQSLEVEIIVVDGGSQDHTVEVARSLGVTVISAPAGRASQMNAGAAIASGKVLLFLHADTQLPPQFDIHVWHSLMQPHVIAGAFALRISGQAWGLRVIERLVNWRSRWLQMPYGDQALFLSAETFHNIGGFPDFPIMEDFELVRRLRRWGKIALVPSPVLTSGRRWQKLGIWRTTWINQQIVMGYLLGIPPSRLVGWYRRDRGIR